MTDEPRDWRTPHYTPRPDDVAVRKEAVIDRQGKQFVLYSGLLDAAHRAGLREISTQVVLYPTSTNTIAIVHAVAVFDWGRFEGIGDAGPDNVSRMILPHVIRMAETRAKARAFRDALNVSYVAVEELIGLPGNDGDEDDDKPASTTVAGRPTPNHDTPAPRPAGRRPVPPPDRSATPAPTQAAPQPTSRVAALTKLERIQSTATRLGIKSPFLQPITDDAEAEDIEEIYQRLLPLVNAALKPADGSGSYSR